MPSFFFSKILALIFLIPLLVAFWFVSLTAILLFAIFLGAIGCTYAAVKHWSTTPIADIPPFYFIVMPAIVIGALFLPTLWLIFIGATILMIYGFAAYKFQRPRREIGIILGAAVVLMVTGALIIGPFYSARIPATFTSGKHSNSIEFSKQDARPNETYSYNLIPSYKSGDQLYKTLFFIGIKTDQNNTELFPNYDLANLSIYINLTSVIPDTTPPKTYWNTSITTRLIAYDDYTRAQFQYQDLSGYELFNEMESQFRLISEVYLEKQTYGGIIQFEANWIPMGYYLLAIDITILPTTENQDLYTWNVPYFEATVGYNISGVLNYDLETDSQGYAWLSTELTPMPMADRLFDDLIGLDAFNMLITFFILFFVCVMVGMLLRNTVIISISNIVIFALFVLGIFASMSTAMENVPLWLSIIAPGTSGKYIWGLFEAIKYGIILGLAMLLIFQLSAFFTTTMQAVAGKSDD